MNVVIATPNSEGLRKDFKVIVAALKLVMRNRNHKLYILRYTWNYFRNKKANEAEFKIPFNVDVVIFLERILDHGALWAAKNRILIPNPEWLRPADLASAGNCNWLWHKTRFSQTQLSAVLDKSKHFYTGFTSIDPNRAAADFKRFGHFRGNLYTRRQTDIILDAWTKNLNWPDLFIHFYSDEAGKFSLPGWFANKNVHIRMGWIEAEKYWDEFSQCGVHLCTSQAEGFGHYLNEARAIGALQITTDGAPMNELADSDCAVLVKVKESQNLNYGRRHLISADALAGAVRQVIGLGEAQRRKMGEAGRQKYLADRQSFFARFQEAFQALA